MTKVGIFYGVGVGPGPGGYLPVAAYEALRQCEVIFAPRALNIQQSVAGQCLSGLDIPIERFRDITFDMERDRSLLGENYAKLARCIADELQSGKNVGYITIGDSLTYSTYSYTLEALLAILPDVSRRTFPGVTSFAAAASALEWPIGQGKERVLILPCPDDMHELKKDILTHDIVVLMKIGHRLPAVIEVLNEMNISSHCALASRVGLPEEALFKGVSDISNPQKVGYLATMLIRKTAVLPRLAAKAAGRADEAMLCSPVSGGES